MHNEVFNDSKYWRAFEENDITHSAAHYLMAVDNLRNDLGYARVTDVAEMLAVSRGAASMALRQLKKRGWLAEDPNRFLLLTEEGRRLAQTVEDNFLILSRFLEQVLGMPREEALIDACKMEHLMSMEAGDRLLRLMRHVLGKPKLAGRIRNAVEEGDEPCDAVEKCPICGGVGECLMENRHKE
jgi:Mn-dependent DtxR family transcriptional regulator